MDDLTTPVDRDDEELPRLPGALEGISRIRLDCEEADLSIEADDALSGAIHLITGGTNAPSMIREADEIIIYQRGRHRGDRRPATLRVPRSGCVPVVGRQQKGDFYAEGLNARLELNHDQGDARVAGGEGDLALDTGKGDVQVDGRSGMLAIRLGAGDVTLTRCAGTAAVSLGRGDVELEGCGGELVVKTGSGDVTVTDSSGSLTVKSGTGDCVITRPRALRITIASGSGDIEIRSGSLNALRARTAKGDITSSAQLLLARRVDAAESSTESEHGEQQDESIAARILRTKGVQFEAGDKGMRIATPKMQFEANEQGLRVSRGGMTFEANEAGVRFVTPDDDQRGSEFALETAVGDIQIDVPAGVPARLEALVNGGDVRSDIPLVSVGRPGPRGSTQRFVGVNDPQAIERLELRLRAERGDIRVRSVAGFGVAPLPPLPVVPPAPAAPGFHAAPSSAAPSQPATLSREERMRAVLDRLARNALTVDQADRLLREIERGG